ncbi:unnamed protein product [Moneuplotes crassus]|uniref:Uncharacterized protein n=1 Tax=Euplotes crassus TaxID=5936 RepID=A0AAD1XB37_EUPCR|nr:unnamed protein product [Moneuplotes crassus]
MKITLVAILLLSIVSARLHLSEIQEERLNARQPNRDWLWYEQRLDHFNPQNKGTFKQKYYDISHYWDPKEGPLFLYICGEGTCRQPAENSFVVNLAKKFSGRVLALEHRFYGHSQPFEDWSTENLQFLTPDQGLADLAQFASDKSKEFSDTFGIPFRRWITVGGSYPGALSAWFREKYPHIAFASLSSSGVVQAVTDYHEYDGQVFKSTSKSGTECPEKFIGITKAFEDLFENSEQLSGEKERVFAKFGYEGDELTDGDFFNFLADIAAGPIQYGKRTDFCNQISQVDLNDQEGTIDWLVKFSEGLGIALSEYPVSYLQDTTINNNKNGRQWTYQFCSNLGYFQTPSHDTYAMRSKQVDVDYWRGVCKNVFGIDIFPNTEAWNNRYGGKELVSTKIIFTNGGEDPWQHSSVTQSDNPTFHTFVIDCDDCAHCVDLHGDYPEDDPLLTDARAQITDIFSSWIKEELELEVSFPSEAKAGIRDLIS